MIGECGWRYEGWLRSNRFHGKGRLIYTDGKIYEGNFLFNLRNGKGLTKYPDGASYYGEYLNDRK